jgi:hypothetical protein
MRLPPIDFAALWTLRLPVPGTHLDSLDCPSPLLSVAPTASHQRRIERAHDAEAVKLIVHESSFFLKKKCVSAISSHEHANTTRNFRIRLGIDFTPYFLKPKNP